MKDLIAFFQNREVQKQILYFFGGLIAFIFLIFLSLRVYTRHGQALSVPDFRGKKLEEASSIADQKRLQLVVSDSSFVQGQEPGVVIGQNPSFDTKVKENRKIFITINAINPEKVDMPDVVGVSLREAEARLMRYGLRIGFKRYVPDPGKDYVLRQIYKNREISKGAKVIKGSYIDLVLGGGYGNSEGSVPNLKGLTLDEAKEELARNYLNFGATIYDNSIESYQDTLNAIIWKQKPEYGTSLSMGSSIDVWFSVSKPKAEPDSIQN
jgi:eukaryotic-like serine/threonine-protein kinase